MKVKWKVCLGVLAVFLLGMIAGGFTTVVLIKKAAEKASERPEAAIVRALDKKLELTEEQRAEVSVVIHDMVAEIEPIRDETRQKLVDVVRRHSPRVRAELNPEQEEKFDQFLLKLGRKWKVDQLVRPEKQKNPPESEKVP